MKICFSMQPNPNCAAGGGVKFASILQEFLQNKGHSVTFALSGDDLPDVILMFDYKKYHSNEFVKWLCLEDIRIFQDQYGMKVPIVHRLNDIGAPKTGRPPDYIDKMSELANRSTRAIYVSNFVKDYYKDYIKTPYTVISNAVDKSVFSIKENTFDKKKKKLVTHHWAPNLLKGWDIYSKIDEWIDERDDIEFTFAGNLPLEVTKLKNIKIHKPTFGDELASLIRESDIYVTASRYEPCGNHYLEGISCGLPILYHKAGGGVNDMSEFGLGFTDFEDFKKKFDTIVLKYDDFYDNIVENFDFYSEKMCEEYLSVLSEAANAQC